MYTKSYCWNYGLNKLLLKFDDTSVEARFPSCSSYYASESIEYPKHLDVFLEILPCFRQAVFKLCAIGTTSGAVWPGFHSKMVTSGTDNFWHCPCNKYHYLFAVVFYLTDFVKDFFIIIHSISSLLIVLCEKLLIPFLYTTDTKM